MVAFPFLFLILMELQESNKNCRKSKSVTKKDYPVNSYDYNGEYYTSEGVVKVDYVQKSRH